MHQQANRPNVSYICFVFCFLQFQLDIKSFLRRWYFVNHIHGSRQLHLENGVRYYLLFLVCSQLEVVMQKICHVFCHSVFNELKNSTIYVCLPSWNTWEMTVVEKTCVFWGILRESCTVNYRVGSVYVGRRSIWRKVTILKTVSTQRLNPPLSLLRWWDSLREFRVQNVWRSYKGGRLEKKRSLMRA